MHVGEAVKPVLREGFASLHGIRVKRIRRLSALKAELGLLKICKSVILVGKTRNLMIFLRVLMNIFKVSLSRLLIMEAAGEKKVSIRFIVCETNL
jgi:hypothetical protein